MRPSVTLAALGLLALAPSVRAGESPGPRSRPRSRTPRFWSRKRTTRKM